MGNWGRLGAGVRQLQGIKGIVHRLETGEHCVSKFQKRRRTTGSPYEIYSHRAFIMLHCCSPSSAQEQGGVSQLHLPNKPSPDLSQPNGIPRRNRKEGLSAHRPCQRAAASRVP